MAIITGACCHMLVFEKWLGIKSLLFNPPKAIKASGRVIINRLVRGGEAERLFGGSDLHGSRFLPRSERSLNPLFTSACSHVPSLPLWASFLLPAPCRSCGKELRFGGPAETGKLLKHLPSTVPPPSPFTWWISANSPVGSAVRHLCCART